MRDVHGSTVHLTDHWGKVVNTYSYDPYGSDLGTTETAKIPNPWRYAGGFYDTESGLYMMGARYYDPSLGRFLQQDPLGGGSSSQYTYASSAPCNNSDPTGMETCYWHITSATIHRLIDQLNSTARDDQQEAIIIGVIGTIGLDTIGAGVGAAIGGIPGAAAGSMIAGAAGAGLAAPIAIRANNEFTAAAYLGNHTDSVYVGYNPTRYGMSGCRSDESTNHDPGTTLPSNLQDSLWQTIGHP